MRPFPVLTLDPPWPYRARATDVTHRARNPYMGGPVRTLAERQRDADEGSIFLPAPVRRHSRKPAEFYPLVETLSKEEPMKKDGRWPQPAVIRITEEETLRPMCLELFARVQLSKGIRQGWAVIGDQFLMDEEANNPNDLPPWQVRWNSLKGTAKEKMAVLDPELADRLTQGGLTLHAAKRILLGRDCDAIAALRVRQLKLSSAPYLTLVPRLIGGRTLTGHLVLKCTCGAVWERLSYFGCANWYWVRCRSCAVRHSFKMLPPTGHGNMQVEWFEYSPTIDEPEGLGCNAIPVRELGAA